MKTAAIRPIPEHARLSPEVLQAVEAWLGGADVDEAPNETKSETRLNDVFERFESEQTALAQYIGDRLSRTRDEVALALGYFLTLATWLAFDRAFGSRIGEVTDLAIQGADESLTLDESLRGDDPTEAVDSDDVVAMEQPHLLAFISDHIDAALEVHADDVDVDAVHRIYRLVLVEVLALSYAVSPPSGVSVSTDEIYA